MQAHVRWHRVLDGALTVDVSDPLGPLANNVYLVAGTDGRALVVDPAIGAREAVLEVLAARGWTLDLILATHQHFDHIAEAGPLAAATGAPIAAHRLEAPLMARPAHPLLFPDLEVPPAAVSRELFEGEDVVVAGHAWRVLHTPGHTPGSICLALALPESDVLLSGDTLFAGSYGRYDLPGGDPRLLRDSLRRLAALPARTLVLPGHGQRTTIGGEPWLARPPGL